MVFERLYQSKENEDIEYCPHCGKRLAIYDSVNGRIRNCQNPDCPSAEKE